MARPVGQRRYVVTDFDDGRELVADTTKDLDDEHDATHAVLARLLGLDGSPVLTRVLDGRPLDDDLVDAEEAAVLAVDKFRRMLAERGYLPKPA